MVSIWGMTSLIEKAVQRKTQRASGLQAKLDQTLGEVVYETEVDSFE